MGASDEHWSLEVLLKDMLLDTNMGFEEMAKRLNITQAELHRQIRRYGLGWVRKTRKKMSRGQAALTDIMQRLLPHEEIVNEHGLGERLRLDIFCPSYKLAAEYHGRQHFFYSDLFYDRREDFIDAQNRDIRKEELCREQGIALIVFRFNDKLTEDAVHHRMLEAIRSTPYHREHKISSFKGSHHYEQVQQSRRDYNRKKYKQVKRWRDENRKRGKGDPS